MIVGSAQSVSDEGKNLLSTPISPEMTLMTTSKGGKGGMPLDAAVTVISRANLAPVNASIGGSADAASFIAAASAVPKGTFRVS